jgi:hypothetical protein
MLWSIWTIANCEDTSVNICFVGAQAKPTLRNTIQFFSKSYGGIRILRNRRRP